jgi:hypothetical protein
VRKIERRTANHLSRARLKQPEMISIRHRESRWHSRIIAFALCLAVCFAVCFSSLSFAQTNSSTNLSASQSETQARAYPKEIRGYKVELARVELKKANAKDAKKSGSDEADDDNLIRLGEPHVASVSPFGITLEVPITVAAVKQGGHVDFLTFEEMTVNGAVVTVNEYQHPFDLPNDHSVTLPDPVSIYISTPRAMLTAIDEWRKPKDIWPVTGRVYVFGHFKKFLFNFKRVVPVELKLSFHNPLKSKPTDAGLKQVTN